VDDDSLSAGAVARRLGVAVTTLRTWHQRYGLGPSRHIPGRHRRYTADDLTRLEVMRRLTAAGVPAATAARRAARGVRVPDEKPARHGGGRVIAVGRAGAAARGLARAAMRLDTPAMRDLLQRAVAEQGVVAAWDTVLCPVLVGVGRRHAATSALVEVEHLISRTASEVLGAVPRPGGTPRILLACADEEQHTLPLEALAAALAEAGTGCRLLGARVPPRALYEAVARTGPAAVLVWSQMASTGGVDQLRPLVSGPDRPLLVAAAGPGWPRAALPEGTATSDRLADAVALLIGSGSPLLD
jgi:MerR family transcriptional regulator, light-induced transcriptional regulator